MLLTVAQIRLRFTLLEMADDPVVIWPVEPVEEQHPEAEQRTQAGGDAEKHTDPLRSSNINIEGSRDWFVTRLAEMYLIAAEALMKQGKAAEGVSFINILRERAAWPGQEAAMRIAPEQLTLDFILNERAFELAGEMFRWPDLKRTGKLLERVKLYNPEARANIKEMHLVRPIPTNMIDRITNKEEFLQNEGY